jgi:hypothetical protein
LGLPSADLRQLVWSIPSLGDVIYQELEQAIDEAEQTVRDALRSDNLSKRLAAAAFILRMSGASAPTFEVGLHWERAVDYDPFIFSDRIAYGFSMRSRPLLFADLLS